MISKELMINHKIKRVSEIFIIIKIIKDFPYL